MPPILMPERSTTTPTAILSALEQEQRGLVDLLQAPSRVAHAGREFWLGHLHGHAVVLALSKIGKVAAATTATALLERFGVGRIVFTGVAGGLGAAVNVGDVVVATDFVQHDLDASPLFPRFEVPLYGKARFQADDALAEQVWAAATRVLGRRAEGDEFASARVHRGLIASGDRFVSGVGESRALHGALTQAGHAVLAVEMEGAAVAQVCHDYGIPFAAIRTISDRADDTAHVDFPHFVEHVASRYARDIMGDLLAALPVRP